MIPKLGKLYEVFVDIDGGGKKWHLALILETHDRKLEIYYMDEGFREVFDESYFDDKPVIEIGASHDIVE